MGHDIPEEAGLPQHLTCKIIMRFNLYSSINSWHLVGPQLHVIFPPFKNIIAEIIYCEIIYNLCIVIHQELKYMEVISSFCKLISNRIYESSDSWG